MLGLAGKIFDKLLFFLHTLLLCLKWQQPCASALKICLKNRCLGYGTAVWVEKMLDDKALFDANDASIRAGPWITGAAGPQPRGCMAGWMEPPKVPDPTYTTGSASSRRPCLHCRAHTRSPTQRNYWTCALSSSSLVVIIQCRVRVAA